MYICIFYWKYCSIIAPKDDECVIVVVMKINQNVIPLIPHIFLESPGKLKHSLNINVQALLPGRAPPVRQLLKSQSLDPQFNKESNSPEENLSSKQLDTKRPGEEVKNDQGKIDIGGVSNAEILHSITKVRLASTKWQRFYSSREIVKFKR